MSVVEDYYKPEIARLNRTVSRLNARVRQLEIRLKMSNDLLAAYTAPPPFEFAPLPTVTKPKQKPLPHLTPAQIRALTVISIVNGKGNPVFQETHKLLVRVVNALVRKGMVERKVGRYRYGELWITPAGKERV